MLILMASHSSVDARAIVNPKDDQGCNRAPGEKRSAHSCVLIVQSKRCSDDKHDPNLKLLLARGCGIDVSINVAQYETTLKIASFKPNTQLEKLLLDFR